MGQAYFAPIRPVPENATKEERLKAFEEYKKEMMMLNPQFFNSDGSVKTVWQTLKSLFSKPKDL